MQNTSLVLMLITIFTKCFGLAREKALAHFFGTSAMANIFLIAFTLPMLVSNLFAGSLAGGFIPVYTELKDRKGREAADAFTTHLARLVAYIALAVGVCAAVFAPQLVHLMARGFTGAVFEQTVYMSRITALSVVTTAVFSIFKSYLQIYNHFIVSISHSVVMNSILILTMILGRGGNTTLLALGILFAFVFQYIFFLPYLKKSGFRLHIGDKDERALRQLLYLILPILISTSVLEINVVVSKSLASMISTAGVAVINYATKIQGFVTGIVVTSIVTVTYPKMAALVKEDAALKRVFAESLSLMGALVVPATVGVLCFHKEIVRLLFLGGAFSAGDVAITGEVLLFYGLGLFAIGIREIGVRIFYSKKQTRIPVVNSAYMVLANIVLSVLLGRAAGLKGLAIATAISLWIGAVGMLLHLRRNMGGLGLFRVAKNFLKICGASAVMGACALGAYRWLCRVLSNNLALLGAIAVAGIVYLVAIWILKIQETKAIRERFFS